MIDAIIAWSIKQRALVLMLSIVLGILGFYALKTVNVDAIPDLSDTQVIIKTSYPGQAPEVVEDQVTYPISTQMLSVPGAKTVRGYSFLGDSFIYIIFEEGTDIYWARSRVLEYLNQVQSKLPAGVTPALGPDASGVGWVYQYVLVDETNTNDISQLTTLQNWFLKYELQSLPGVAEVATVGGMVQQYQVVVDINTLRQYNLSLSQVANAIKRANQETSGSVIEMAEAEYMVRTNSFVNSLESLSETLIRPAMKGGNPILLKHIADIRKGPEMRRGIAEHNGEGETVGGIIVMRQGENALNTIEHVKQKIASLQNSLPDGVEIVPVYDRTDLIQGTIDHLKDKLIEEIIVVSIVCLLFLLHFRSALVAVISLPLGIATAFIIINMQGITANVMSLGGIAIAIGAMVDGAIVMIENCHKHLEAFRHKHKRQPDSAEHWDIVLESSKEVGGAIFFSLLIITVSFLPIFGLQAQEGKLFTPLAFTKTYAMAIAAGFAITLVPVLMGFFIRGRIVSEHYNPLCKLLIFVYKPLLEAVLRFPKVTIFLVTLLLFSTLIPLYGLPKLINPIIEKLPLSETQQVKAYKNLENFSKDWSMRDAMGTEFMPDMFEGDLLYMPTTLPGISVGKARQILQQTDKLIRTLPEVENVFGKIGRAQTATDPAPLTMIETTIQLKPRDQWREGLTLNDLITELDQTVQIPGLTNSWVQPIKTRIDMLSTGIKTPIGIKVSGADLSIIQNIGQDIERILGLLPETRSVYSERVEGGRYVVITPNRKKLAEYGFSIQDLTDTVKYGIGGATITETIEGRERFPINIRFPQSSRENVNVIRQLPLISENGRQIPIEVVADVNIAAGPPMLKSENATLTGWTFVDLTTSDLKGYIEKAQQALDVDLKLPPGYTISWSGQYEYLERAAKSMQVLIPVTLMIIFVFLYFALQSFTKAILIITLLPFALTGSIWGLWYADFQLSIAVAVGLIALAGVAAEFGVVMVLYLDQALKASADTKEAKYDAIIAGAAKRIRPKAMTVATIVAGLIPIFLTDGLGSEAMQRIALPMIGGMVSAPLVSLFLIPAIYWVVLKRRFSGQPST